MAVALGPAAAGAQTTESGVRVERLLEGPIITPDLHPSLGVNIQGPSLIEVPDWVEDPLGRYYLYFADHKGLYIRLAYADNLLGPWTVHPPGSLQIADSYFLTEPPEVAPDVAARLRASQERRGVPMSHDGLFEATTPHIASPDVHVDDANRRIVMYFHGLDDVSTQTTRVATSPDGIHFETRPERLGRTYMRVFEHDGYTYALSMPGQFYRSRNPLGGFEQGPLLFNPDMRHLALLKRDDTLYVFLDAGGRGARAHQAEHDRSLRRLDGLEGDCGRRGAAARVRLGRGRRAARAFGAEHRLRAREPASGSGNLRGRRQRPHLPALRRGRRERHRDRGGPFRRVAGRDR